MSPILILSIVAIYFAVLFVIGKITSKGADNDSFFIGNKQSPWWIVAFGMIGTSLSGVTFISVPGWVGTSQFSYMQMVLGYLVGYTIIATVLMPLYYRLNLTSIYTYLDDRFGRASYRTGASFFLLSRTMGAAFRLYLVAGVFQYLLLDDWGVPFFVTVLVTILLIWLYTYKGGIKTIVWTDTLQTLFMLVAVGLTVYVLASKMGLTLASVIEIIDQSNYGQVFFFDDISKPNYFWKQFFTGAAISVVMTGLDQDMMQKNLSCRNIGDAQKNMFSFSIVLVLVNWVFLSLGALLYMYAENNGISLPERADNLYPMLATEHLPVFIGIMFVLGLIVAAYSSADSALTALTTSACVDLLDIEKKEKREQEKLRMRVHILMSVILFITILIFRWINDDSVISNLFKAAGFTYGPLLGLYTFGLLTKRKVQDSLVPVVCIVSVLICILIWWFPQLVGGYEVKFEVLILNGFITFMGLFLISKKEKSLREI
ncbi:MAG: sodium:solute symporter [Flavobacteriales bacterium]|nr:sodium:solute symporter [Flavobacteriales bacterium]